MLFLMKYINANNGKNNVYNRHFSDINGKIIQKKVKYEEKFSNWRKSWGKNFKTLTNYENLKGM